LESVPEECLVCEVSGHERISVSRLGPAKSRNSETGGRGKNAALESKLRVCKVFMYPFDRRLSVLLVSACSPPNGADAGLASVDPESIREGLEHIVTCLVPEGIVDLLEKVQVSHHDPKKGSHLPCGSTAALS
jgi:hypothetical protein